MRNLAEIMTIVENGDLESAHQALDGLLAMGPQNLEALKLRARLFEVAGRFQQEAKIWEQIAKIDREDHDFIQYILRRQTEDRENFYFTDQLPTGGRRFIAFPRKMVRAASLGLVGCILFLGLARLSSKFTVLNHPFVMLSTFGLFVISPWLAILTFYAKSLRFIAVTKSGIEVATRFRRHQFLWSNIDHVYLAQDDRHDTYRLSLVVVGKESNDPCFELDFNEHSTQIKARSYLVREIMMAWGEPKYVSRKTINTDGRKTIRA